LRDRFLGQSPIATVAAMPWPHPMAPPDVASFRRRRDHSQRGRPNGRPMTGSGGRSRIPETSMLETNGRSVLDTPCAGYDSVVGSGTVAVIARSPCDEAIHPSLLRPWIASRSLSSGSPKARPVVRNDEMGRTFARPIRSR
jgi:hypothetical protein